MIKLSNILLFIVLFTAMSTCGCSTLLSQHEKTGQYSLFVDPGVLCAHHRNDMTPAYYGGVSIDFYLAFFAPFRDDEIISSLTRVFYPISLTYSVIDLPFSLVADTIIFPYNYYVLSNCYVIEDGEKYSRWSEGSKYRICSTPKIEKIRDEFQKLYDQKDYVQARAKLETVVNTCSSRTNFATLGWIRNDLAITLYKLGDYSGCLDVLKPLQEYANETDENFQSKYVSMYGPQFGPKTADTAIQLAKTTRANLKLCNRVP